MKCEDMSFKECFLFLKRKRHYKTRLRIIQAHHKHLHRLARAVDLCLRFSPIHLRVLSNIELQWQIRWTMFSRPPLQTDIVVQITFTAAIPFHLQELIYLVSCISLLPWHLLTFLDQLFDPRSIRPDLRRSLRFFRWYPSGSAWSRTFRIALRLCPNCLLIARMLNLSTADILIVVHRFHLLCTSGAHRTENKLYGGLLFDNNFLPRWAPFII